VNYAILEDTIGTYEREEPAWDLDIKVEQAIPMRRGKMAASVEITNVTNNRQGLDTAAGGASAYISSDNRWIIAYRQDPMQVTVGVKYEF
jgi:hypothetical protein